MRAWVLLLVAGCATSSDVAPGFEVRLVARGPFALGRPLPLSLEATNRSPHTLTFDAQGLSHSPYEVRTADGRAVPYVDPRAGGIGTFQRFVALKPGETRVIDEIDVAAEYAILEPGDYVASFGGLDAWGKGMDGWTHGGPEGAVLTAVPPSPPLRFRVGPGALSGPDRILLAILRELPEDWIVYRSGDGLNFQKWKVAGSPLYALVETRFAETKDAARIGPLWVSPLRLAGKAERKPSDDPIEAELRRTNPVPALISRIR